MSQYRNWKNIEEYDFLKEASKNEWAWELLRRDKKYIADFKHYISRKKEATKLFGNSWSRSYLMYDFFPEMIEEDQQDRGLWLRRVVALDINFDPYRTHISSRAYKWELSYFKNPEQEYSEGPKFKKSVWPKRILQENEFDNFIEEQEVGVDDELMGTVRAVGASYIVFAFDLSSGITDQMNKAKEIFKKQRKDIKNSKYSSAINGSSVTSDPSHFIRHIRVLDAFAAEPDLKLADLAIGLGFVEKEYHENEDLAGRDANAQGYDWKNQAIKAQREYKKFIDYDQKSKKEA